MFLLSLSHATFHSFPELNYPAIDIFSCGPAEPQSVLSMLTKTLAPRRVEGTLAMRGATNGDMDSPSADEAPFIAASYFARRPSQLGSLSRLL